MKNDVGLAKESAFMLIVLLLIMRKFLVVAGNTDKTIRWPSYNCKGWKPDAVYICLFWRLWNLWPYRTETLKQLLSMEIAYNNMM